MKIDRSILSEDRKLKDKVYNYFLSKTDANKKDIDYALHKHSQYGTMVHEKGKYLCFYNIYDDTAKITHLVSLKCGVKGIRNIAREIKGKHVFITKLQYEREFKSNSKKRVNDITKYIK